MWQKSKEKLLESANTQAHNLSLSKIEKQINDGIKSGISSGVQTTVASFIVFGGLYLRENSPEIKK